MEGILKLPSAVFDTTLPDVGGYLVAISLAGLDFIWLLTDTLNAFMAVPNLLALLLLSFVTLKLTRELFARGGAGDGGVPAD